MFGSLFSANVFWLEGPAFLQSHPENWPSVLPQNDLLSKEALQEKVKLQPNVLHVMVSTGADPEISNFDISWYSSKRKVLRTFLMRSFGDQNNHDFAKSRHDCNNLRSFGLFVIIIANQNKPALDLVWFDC